MEKARTVSGQKRWGREYSESALTRDNKVDGRRVHLPCERAALHDMDAGRGEGGEVGAVGEINEYKG